MNQVLELPRSYRRWSSTLLRRCSRWAGGATQWRFALLAVALGQSACGSRGTVDSAVVCKPASAVCLTPQLGQICNAQGQWATFQCAPDQECQEGGCVAAGGPCSPGKTQCVGDQVGQICDKQGQWKTFVCASGQTCRDDACAATQTCSAGTMQCLNTRVGQICNERQEWTTFECADDETCLGDACIGANESCLAEASQCLSSEVARICNSQGQWISFQCGAEQACVDQACAGTTDACSEGTNQCLSPQVQQSCNEAGKWETTLCKQGQSCVDGKCRGACTPEAHECVTTRQQRICLSDGTSWLTTECPEGLACVDGECVGSCEPGTKLCAARGALRECRSDGAGYVEQICPANTMCEKGVCVADPLSPCEGNYGICQDARTLLRCKVDGSGYDATTCAEGTQCSDGQCMGALCAAGSTSCTTTTVSNLNGVQTCNDDGTEYSVALCRANEVCVLNSKTGLHECYDPPCTKNETRCGDPNGSYSDSERLSRCEVGLDGKLRWVSYLCTAPTTCTVDEWDGAKCYADCAPGTHRCSSEENAIETCGDDGKWSAQSCEPAGGANLFCLLTPTSRRVVCGDADCANLQYGTDEYRSRGRCVDAQIRRCGDDGKLQPAVACEEGMCLPDPDGFGSCKDPSRCNQSDGWRECVTDNDAYRTCVSNHWEFTLCPAEQLCTDDGLGNAACGNGCTPEARRCDGPKYQVCGADGTWGESQSCATGECNSITKRCEVACQPDEVRCVGDVIVASDGTSLGSSAMQVCQSDGRWGTSQACDVAAGQACRRSGHGVHLGCVQCIGDAVPGGNEENAVDSRCTQDALGRQVCQTSNTWPTDSIRCDANETCAKRRDGNLRGTCSDNGCSNNNYSRRCVAYNAVDPPQTISDCCSGDCDTESKTCWHRQSEYDPTCPETMSCYTGRSDEDSNPIYDTCCTGYCVYGQGCLRTKKTPCASVTSCEVTRLGASNVCCGSCQSDGSCYSGQQAEHPSGEYFMCGSSSNLCWSIGSCAWEPWGGVSGAMYANCQAAP